jgi:hypothetical protein
LVKNPVSGGSGSCKKPGWQKTRFLVGQEVVRNRVGKKPGFCWAMEVLRNRVGNIPGFTLGNYKLTPTAETWFFKKTRFLRSPGISRKF